MLSAALMSFLSTWKNIHGLALTSAVWPSCFEHLYLHAGVTTCLTVVLSTTPVGRRRYFCDEAKTVSLGMCSKRAVVGGSVLRLKSGFRVLSLPGWLLNFAQTGKMTMFKLYHSHKLHNLEVCFMLFFLRKQSIDNMASWFLYF